MIYVCVIIAFLCAKQKCAKNLTGFVLFKGFIHEVLLPFILQVVNSLSAKLPRLKKKIWVGG